jgi:single-strand DNA-binding protein
MPASFNKVILVGNLTRDPEVRTTPGGTKIAKLGLAVNRRYRTRDSDELKEEVTYVDIDAFNQQAELMERYCQKGSGLLVEGRLRLDQWETANGEKRNKLCVVMENFQFLSGREDSSGGESTRDDGGRSGSTNRPASSGSDRGSASSETRGGDTFQEDDEVPF